MTAASDSVVAGAVSAGLVAAAGSAVRAERATAAVTPVARAAAVRPLRSDLCTGAPRGERWPEQTGPQEIDRIKVSLALIRLGKPN